RSLQERAGLHEQWSEATKPWTGPEWGQGRRLLSAARTLPSLDGLPAQRAAAGAAPLGRATCVRCWSLRETMTPPQGAKRVRLAPLAAREQAGCQRLGPAWQSAYARVQERLRRVVRARRAVECRKSVMRRHQARQRHVRLCGT